MPHFKNFNERNPRLKRIVQAIDDLYQGNWKNLKILDLGSLEGQFPIEFGLQGANAVGIEIRDSALKKAELCRKAFVLRNVRFYKDDVRNICKDQYGEFDIIVCSGILYHLDAPDLFHLLERCHEMTRRAVIIDTHVSLTKNETRTYKNEKYFGATFIEHPLESTLENRKKNVWAPIDNPKSFWLTKISLFNFLNSLGFSSLFESQLPVPEFGDRVALICQKGKKAKILTSKLTNSITSKWPETDRLKLSEQHWPSSKKNKKLNPLWGQVVENRMRKRT